MAEGFPIGGWRWFGSLRCALVLSALLAACANSAARSNAPSAESSAPAATASSEPGAVAASGGRASPAGQSANEGPQPASAAPSGEPTRAPELPRGTLVLHVGDSFADSLGAPLGRLFVRNGLRNVLDARTPSYTPGWAYRQDLARLLARYNPDLVLVTLGGNEFDIPNPEERVPAVERIVKVIGERPCVWITPPRWKKDTGILGIIREHAAPCRVLDSDSLVQELPRKRDGIHPSEVGRERWANAVLTWLMAARDPAGASPWALR